MGAKLNVMLAAAAGAAIAGTLLMMRRGRGLQEGGYGSPTNASDAVDEVELKRNASSERVMDAGVEGTFPASDPVSVENAYETAHEREQRGETAPERPAESQRRRSPDWLTTH
jgi:hypothetical protein